MVKTDLYTAIEACRICGGKDLNVVIDLGEQALTGCFPASDEPMPPLAPLQLVMCEKCGLVQLKHSVRIEKMFGENYGYRSGINSTMRDHLSGIAAAAERKVTLNEADIVLDIGCNDGTLLKSYRSNGIRRVGLDPIAAMFRSMYSEELMVRSELFSQEAFRALFPDRNAKIITSISMFYDLEDPKTFVEDIRAILDRDGVWILEQSYLPRMLDQVSFDTICHEHLEYYALRQIEYLTVRARLKIVDVIFNDTNGGSFQIWVAHDDSRFVPETAKIQTILDYENTIGLNDNQAFEKFRRQVVAVREKLKSLLVREAQAGKKIYVYGASTKGNVLLQYLELPPETIVACADRNPIKWGRRTPGTNIPIVPEDDARDTADYFLVLPWHFKEEFLARESTFLKSGGKFIFPLPVVEIVGYDHAEGRLDRGG